MGEFIARVALYVLKGIGVMASTLYVFEEYLDAGSFQFLQSQLCELVFSEEPRFEFFLVGIGGERFLFLFAILLVTALRTFAFRGTSLCIFPTRREDGRFFFSVLCFIWRLLRG